MSIGTLITLGKCKRYNAMATTENKLYYQDRKERSVNATLSPAVTYHAEEDEVSHVLGGEACDEVLRRDVNSRLFEGLGGFGGGHPQPHEGRHAVVILLLP